MTAMAGLYGLGTLANLGASAAALDEQRQARDRYIDQTAPWNMPGYTGFDEGGWINEDFSATLNRIDDPLLRDSMYHAGAWTPGGAARVGLAVQNAEGVQEMRDRQQGTVDEIQRRYTPIMDAAAGNYQRIAGSDPSEKFDSARGRVEQHFDTMMNQPLELTDAMTTVDVQRIAQQAQNRANQQGQARARQARDMAGGRGLSGNALAAIDAQFDQAALAEAINAELEAEIQRSLLNAEYRDRFMQRQADRDSALTMAGGVLGDISASEARAVLERDRQATGALSAWGGLKDDEVGYWTDANNILTQLYNPLLETAPFADLLDYGDAYQLAREGTAYGMAGDYADLLTNVGGSTANLLTAPFLADLSKPEAPDPGFGAATIGALGQIGGGWATNWGG